MYIPTLALVGDMAWYIPLLIFIARIFDVSIGTVRTILVISGHAIQAAVLGFFEVIIWVLAIGGVVAYLSNPFALGGYAAGFAIGVLLGMAIEQRVALGHRIVRAISTDMTINLSQHLRERGYRVTRVDGHGRSGPVEIAYLIIPRRELTPLREAIQEIDPHCFLSVGHAERPTVAALTHDSRFSKPYWLRATSLRK